MATTKRKKKKTQKIKNVGKDVEKREPCAALVGTENSAATVENCSQKIKHRVTV